jgi:hypothetical protein
VAIEAAVRPTGAAPAAPILPSIHPQYLETIMYLLFAPSALAIVVIGFVTLRSHFGKKSNL